MPIEIYKITEPRLRTEPAYFFTSDHGIEYEVRFGREVNNYQNAFVAFSIMNDEFDEYDETNKGDFFRVIHTVIKIIDMYIKEHPFIQSIKFTAQARKDEDDNNVTKRLKFYKRYIPLYESKGWKIHIDVNHVLMKR